MKRDYLSTHRAHDYAHLIARWRVVAERAGLVMRKLATTEGSGNYPIYYLKSRTLPKEGTVFISSGIHGDEAGATEGFISWAEKNVRTLKARPFLLLPCINPWGLVNNSRTDSERRDLNRTFQDDAVPEIAAIRRLTGKRNYALVMTLHEDYDAQGIYIYEIKASVPYWGEGLLAAAAPYVPADVRGVVEERENDRGLIRVVPDMEFFKKVGIPEALHFYLAGCTRVYTIETPSEYGLDRRVAAHEAVIGECLRRLGKAERGRTRGAK